MPRGREESEAYKGGVEAAKGELRSGVVVVAVGRAPVIDHKWLEATLWKLNAVMINEI